MTDKQQPEPRAGETRAGETRAGETRDRLLTLLRVAEPTRNLNTTALTNTADEMLAMAVRIGWVVTIEPVS